MGSALNVRFAKADELIFMGEESNGFLHVTSDKGEGWIEKLLIRKKQQLGSGGVYTND